MPVIERFARFKICMYADDHPPPHIHVVGKGFAFVVRLDTLQVVAGRFPPGLDAEALSWASENRDRLRAAWESLNERG